MMAWPKITRVTRGIYRFISADLGRTCESKNVHNFLYS